MRKQFEKMSLVLVGLLSGVLISLTYSALADKDIRPQLPLDDLRALSEVFGKIKTDYVEPVEDKKLLNDAISGMLQGLDPHSAYLDPDAYKDLQAGTQGEFGGLGIEVGMEDGFVKVISPIEDTPAYRAGIKAGDLIIKLDDKIVKGMSLTDAVKLMRGKPNTDIVLTVMRKGETKPLTIKITRAIIKTQSVKYKMIEPNYGYVRVTQFQEHTGQDLAKALTALHDQNKAPLKGLVLDLRNNPGGLLNGAVGVAAGFLPQNSLVVYTDGRAPDAKMYLTATAENYIRGGFKADYWRDEPAEYKTIPIVVLVNGGSASASEIVAGALQDHKRATIMGTQSFGKGSVQTILPMNNGAAIKLTTARYYTPGGRSIQAKGIVPDIKVQDPNMPSDDEWGIREADLSHHLSNPTDKDKKPSDKDSVGKPEVKQPATEADGANEKSGTDKSGAVDKNGDKAKDGKDANAKPTDRKPIEPGSEQDYQFKKAVEALKSGKIVPGKSTIGDKPPVKSLEQDKAATVK